MRTVRRKGTFCVVNFLIYKIVINQKGKHRNYLTHFSTIEYYISRRQTLEACGAEPFIPRQISMQYIWFCRRPQCGIVREDFLNTVLKILGAKRHEDINIKTRISNICRYYYPIRAYFKTKIEQILKHRHRLHNLILPSLQIHQTNSMYD